MKKFHYGALLAVAAVALLGCELEEELGGGPGVSRPEVENVPALQNSNATVVSDPATAETLLNDTIGEVSSLIEAALSSSNRVAGPAGLVPSVSIRPAVVDEDTTSESWDDTVAGPLGGTAETRGSYTESYRNEYPDSDALPATATATFSYRESENTTFDQFQWSSSSQSASYSYSGAREVDMNASSDVSVTVRALDADDNPTEFDASLTYSIQGGIALYGTLEPTSGSGNAIRFIFYVEFGFSEEFAFDESDGDFSTVFAGSALDESQISVSGQLQIFDADGSEVASKEYSSLAELEAIGVQ